MSKLAPLYLERVFQFAELDPQEHREKWDELEDHLLSSIEAEKQAGLGDEEATLKAIRKMGHPQVIGSRLSRPWRWLDVRATGTARGFVAIGPKAVGVIAFGGYARGFIAIGGLSIGVISNGGLGIGLFSWSGLSLALISYGGLALGGVTWGGLSAGILSQGGFVTALVSRGGGEVHSFYKSMAAAPEWIQSFAVLEKVMYWVNVYSPVLLGLYVVVVLACIILQNLHNKRWNKTSTESWLMD
ncbi:MAG: permease prefix domain 1-containing protein [Verrucomicrobiota bacterium]